MSLSFLIQRLNTAVVSKNLNDIALAQNESKRICLSVAEAFRTANEDVTDAINNLKRCFHSESVLFLLLILPWRLAGSLREDVIFRTLYDVHTNFASDSRAICQLSESQLGQCEASRLQEIDQSTMAAGTLQQGQAQPYRIATPDTPKVSTACDCRQSNSSFSQKLFKTQGTQTDSEPHKNMKKRGPESIETILTRDDISNDRRVATGRRKNKTAITVDISQGVHTIHDTERNSFMAEKSGLMEQLIELQSEVQSLRNSLIEKSTINEELQRDKSFSTNQIDELKTELQLCQESLLQHSSVHQADVTRFEQTTTDYSEKLDRLLAENEQLKLDYKQLETLHLALKDKHSFQVSKTKEELWAKCKEVTTLELKLDDCLQRNRRLQNSLDHASVASFCKRCPISDKQLDREIRNGHMC
ncbi:hypothetical protein HDE_00513 [Halotydeus destructor]|nr:hypothetical protein HDE_00513 [Halotydeus destructor]